MNISRLKSQLKIDEGYRQHPYKCTKGKTTIGYGRNLDDVGISMSEAEYLLHKDIEAAMRNHVIQDITAGLDDVREEVIINMAFNLGLPRLLKFKKMLAALAQRNYEQTAAEMKDSLWYKQVGPRAKRLIREMRTGKKER